ncbi:Hypothetical_protein [Hexamita inflata]|uniref:Hypothetical_protein n=1 Tax=Hexamita inflata TaxID=28002 RepID=A0ABP1ISW7_9EUKA
MEQVQAIVHLMRQLVSIQETQCKYDRILLYLSKFSIWDPVIGASESSIISISNAFNNLVFELNTMCELFKPRQDSVKQVILSIRSHLMEDRVFCQQLSNYTDVDQLTLKTSPENSVLNVVLDQTEELLSEMNNYLVLVPKRLEPILMEQVLYMKRICVLQVEFVTQTAENGLDDEFQAQNILTDEMELFCERS